MGTFFQFAGLQKVKRCLQEFFTLLCAYIKKRPLALSHATFSVRLCFFHAFMYLLHSSLSVYFHLMYHLILQMNLLHFSDCLYFLGCHLGVVTVLGMVPVLLMVSDPKGPLMGISNAI